MICKEPRCHNRGTFGDLNNGIMDYEQKYKEAIERAKEFMTNKGVTPNADAFKTAKELIGTIFTELKENEDERIRKELIERLKWELQGAEDQDAAGGCSRQKDIAMFKRGLAWIEKQGEQKSAEWSEEDKAILLSVKCVIDNVWHNSGLLDYDEKELQEMWKWLDEIWRRVAYPQPKQEWNEEDESHIGRILSYLESFKAYNAPHIEPIKKEIDWLKSLKERMKGE